MNFSFGPAGIRDGRQRNEQRNPGPQAMRNPPAFGDAAPRNRFDDGPHRRFDDGPHRRVDDGPHHRFSNGPNRGFVAGSSQRFGKYAPPRDENQGCFNCHATTHRPSVDPWPCEILQKCHNCPPPPSATGNTPHCTP